MRVSYQGKTVNVGIDVHKQSYVLSAYCEGSVVKKSCRMEASPKACALFLLDTFSGARIRTAYEAGFSGYGLHRVLEENGIESHVVNPASIPLAVNDRVKTDARDSMKLGIHLEGGLLKSNRVPSRKEEQARELNRTRAQLVSHRSVVAKQIKAKLDLHGYRAASDTRAISRKYIKELMEKDFPIEIKIALKCLDLWMHLSDAIGNLRKELERQAEEDSDREEIYRSAPGIGLICSRTLANELGDMSRFPNERTLFSYLGLAPSEYSSGDRIRRGNITRQGPGYLRGLLVEAAWRAIAKDTELRNKYEQIKQRAGGKKAIVAIARILVGRIRSCLKNGQAYRKVKDSIG